MIYIVVYKEVSLALTLDSAHTKIWLQDLHPNIQGMFTKRRYSFYCHLMDDNFALCSMLILNASFHLNSSAPS